MMVMRAALALTLLLEGLSAASENEVIYGPVFGDWITAVVVQPSGEVGWANVVTLDGDRGLFGVAVSRGAGVGLNLEPADEKPWCGTVSSCQVVATFPGVEAKFTGEVREQRDNNLVFEEHDQFMASLGESGELILSIKSQGRGDQLLSASLRGFTSSYVWSLTGGSMDLATPVCPVPQEIALND